MEVIIWVLILFILIYAIIPYVLAAKLGFWVCWKGKKDAEIALTFDDGPDPVYTPVLLDLLKRERIKATFFLVGERAARHPEIVLRMSREGHCIGLHNYKHQCNWLISPWKNARTLEQSAQIIENITGERPVFYRPPWGMMHLLDFFLHKQFCMVHWSKMFRDWKRKGGSEKVSNGLITRVESGDVILLHDCGVTPGADEDAPQYTIEGLRVAIPALKARGFRFVRMDEMFDKHSSIKTSHRRKERK